MIRIREQVLPDNGTVHIWSLSLDDVELDCPELLSNDEQTRFSGIRHPVARSHFLRSRSALRLILASYVGCAASELVFTQGENGKPELITESEDLRFNLSHSKHCFCLSVTAGCDVGTDIEKIQTNRDYAALARRFFTEEESSLIDTSENGSLFYRMWVLKEAAVKARGMKLLAGLDRFECSLLKNGELKIWDKLKYANESDWSISQWQTGENFVAAVVVHHTKAKFVNKLFLSTTN